MPNLLKIDPRTLPGILGWYDAAQLNGLGVALPADAAAVAQWNDLSGNGRHLVQGTGVNQPTFRVGVAGKNGANPAVRFDGVNDVLSVAVAGALKRPYFVAAVLKNSVADDGAVHAAVAFNADRIGIGLDWLTNNKLTSINDASFSNAGPAGDSALWHIALFMARDLAAAPTPRLLVDGVLNTPAGLDGTNTNQNVNVGGFAAASFWNGDIAEVIIANGDLSWSTMSALQTALAYKYGLLDSQAFGKGG